MNAYNYQQRLRSIWEKAVAKYQDGERSAEDFFDVDESAFLASIGHTAQEVYDFAEDYVSGGEPDFETFALIADIRRSHFIQVMEGKSSGREVDTKDLPAKDLSVEGIEWLPRIIPKAKAKLRGEMSPDLMYGCGGDRKFFKTHDLHPAEFLRLVERHMDDDQRVIDWVVSHSKATAVNSTR